MRSTEEDFEFDQWTRDELRLIAVVASLSVTVFASTMLVVALWLR